MKSLFYSTTSTALLCLFFLGTLTLISCAKDEEPQGPSTISLSQTSIYEKLPAETVVALVSSNGQGEQTYRLVTGEGSDHNAEFEVLGDILRTRSPLDYSEGEERLIRLAVTDQNMQSHEQGFTISLNKFEGAYPSITSPDFRDGEPMPRNSGANNGNVSPHFDIVEVPTNTTSMVLTMRDLDDGKSYHWTVWNIPPSKTRISRAESWQQGVVIGENSFEGIGYLGPFPPSLHRYETSVHFLNENLDLAPNQYISLTRAMVGKLIAQSSIIGTYRP